MSQVTVNLGWTSAGVISQEQPFENIRPKRVSDSVTYATISTLVYDEQLLITTESLPERWKYNKLVGASILVPRVNEGGVGDSDFVSVAVSDSTPNLYSINWYDAESIQRTAVGYNVGSNSFRIPRYKPGGGEYTDTEASAVAKMLVNAGTFFIYPYRDGHRFPIYLKYYDVDRMRLEVFVDSDVTITSKPFGYDKKSGYVNPRQAQTFSWTLDKDGEYSCAGDWTQESAVFHWRSGTSGSWNDIPISGATQSVTIPANTFPIGTIQWYVSGVDNVGTASDSEIYTITTADSPMVATPLAPIGTVEDGSGDIVFYWQEANDTGTTPTGADLQYSQDGSTWTALGHVDGAVTTYTAPGGTLPAGAVMWRVRAYNTDGVAGAWSEAVSFVSVAAPPAPTVSAAAVPFTTVTWQSSGQQAYRITVDGVVYGPFFGTDKNYALKDYLRDGDHTISVEIQGIYGLWSQPGAITITVANSPGDGITLTGSFDRDAALRWETESATMDFLVYRDGKQIGATVTNSFSDRFVLGSHSYQVINRLANGNYTASNVVTGVMRSCTTAIAPFNGGSWQELNLSENSYSEQRFSWTKVSSLRHVTGAVYPVLEISEYENAAGSYDVSFPDVESANAFLSLRGQIVILKSRGGNVVIGALTQIEKANKDFFISFAFTIQRIDWEDYVDAQNS